MMHECIHRTLAPLTSNLVVPIGMPDTRVRTVYVIRRRWWRRPAWRDAVLVAHGLEEALPADGDREAVRAALAQTEAFAAGLTPVHPSFTGTSAWRSAPP